MTLLRTAACAAAFVAPLTEGMAPTAELLPNLVGATHRLMVKIAIAEGFYKRGTIPQTHNNPGALVFVGQSGAVPGKVGSQGGLPFARFNTKVDGWIALKRDILAKLSRGTPLSTAWQYLKEEVTQ